MSNLTVINKYSFPLDANIAKASLESAGIPAFIADEHTINMQWLYSDAMGGVRVLVPQEFEEEAKSILSANFSSTVDAECESKPETCSNCGGNNLKFYTKGKAPAFLVFILAGFPLFFINMVLNVLIVSISPKHNKSLKRTNNSWFLLLRRLF